MVGIAPHPHHQLKFPHYPLLRTITLASLVKGEVLSPEKNSGDYRRDYSAISRHNQPFPKPHYSLKIANTLASPRKRGGGLTARHKPKFYSVFMGYIRLI